MKNRGNGQISGLVFGIYELLLCLYIIITPIINSIKDYTFAGYGAHIWITLLILVFTVLILLQPNSKLKNRYNSLLVFIVFAFELLIESGSIVDVLPILLYCAFLCIPSGISKKKIYSSVYISAIVGAAFSAFAGYTAAGVERTATLVDGSLAVIAIIVVFWAEEDFDKTVVYSALKILGFTTAIVVAGFGMSRARLSIIAVLAILKLFMSNRKFLSSGRISLEGIFVIIILVAAGIGIANLAVTRELFDAISERFSSGFESVGRDDELREGLRLIRKNPIMGAGWGEIKFKDSLYYNVSYYNHNMYIAILARGGIIAGAAFLASFLSLIKAALRKKQALPIIATATLFVLGYGNAGIFNYTICGMLILIMTGLNNSTKK